MRGCTSLGPGPINVLIGGENITRFDGVAVVVEDDWGTAVSLDKVEQTLKD
jgi:hypothetical protein